MSNPSEHVLPERVVRMTRPGGLARWWGALLQGDLHETGKGPLRQVRQDSEQWEQWALAEGAPGRTAS